MSFLSVDGTLVVQLINFAIFFAVLNIVFLQPVTRAIRRRREYINGLVADYDRYQGDAVSLREQAEGIRAAARRDAEQRVAAERARTSNEAAEISAKYAKQAQEIVEAAQAAAQRELDEARAGEAGAVRAVADVMLERVIPEAIR